MSYKVLIIEDDPMVAMINEQYATKNPNFVSAGICRNGKDALEFLSKNKVDLVVLDVYMPYMDGVETLKKIREQNIQTEVIMVTAANDTATLEKTMNLGVVDYLVFGSECGDIKILTDIADVLINHKQEISGVIHGLVKEGLSYPIARVRAVEEAIPNSYEHVEAMNFPNNILGFEYIRALKQFESSIIPVTNLRIGAGYHDRMMDNPICSSLAIRSSLGIRPLDFGNDHLVYPNLLVLGQVQLFLVYVYKRKSLVHGSSSSDLM